MAISEAEVELIAQRVAKATVAETLTALGLNPAEPQSAQKDMAFLHDLRTAADSTKTTAWYVLVTIAVTGFCGFMYVALFGRLPPG